MRTRPKIFTGMALALAGVALSIPVQIMFLYGHAPDEMGAVLNKVTPLNWVVMGLCVACAMLSLRASPWLKALVPLTVMAVAWNNWVVGLSELNFTSTQAAAGLAAFGALQVGWLHPQARFLLAHPERRWWLTPLRKKIKLPVFVKVTPLDTIKTLTFDLSSGGIFLAFGIRDLNGHPDALLSKLAIGSRLELNIVMNPLRTVHCEAEVVRAQRQPTGDYPAGLGLKFLNVQGLAEEEIDQLMAA